MQIQHGKNGYLVNTPEEGARRVVELLKDDWLRGQMGTAGRETVRRSYLIPRLLRDYLALIEDVVLARDLRPMQTCRH